MSVGAERVWRYAICFAAFCVGLAAALVGVRQLSISPAAAPAASPRVPPAAPAPAARADVPSPSSAVLVSLADIRRLPGEARRLLALYLLADRQGAQGVARMLDEAGTIEQPDERAAAMAILYGRYADLDPAAALRHVQRRGDSADSWRWLKVVFRAWARSDMDAAMRSAETLGADQRISAGAAILQARDDLPLEARVEIAARLAPQGALQLLYRVPHWPMDGSLADDPARFWRQALAQNSGLSFAQVMMEPDGLDFAVTTWSASELHLRRVAELWGRIDARAALDAIASAQGIDSEPGMRMHLFEQVVREWALTEPAAALEWALEHPAAQSSRALLDAVLRTWAATDPRTALDAVQSADNVDPGLRDSLRWDAIKKWTRSDPAAAVDWAMALPDPQARSRSLDAALNTWANDDPRAAAAWLDSQPHDPLGAYRMQSVVAASYAEHHPEEAIAWAEAQPSDIFWPMELVFASLASNDPEHAASLLARVEDADARRTAERVLVRAWAGDDPHAALAWLNRHADPNRRAALHSTLLCAWVVDDFAGAMRHLDGMTDPRTRSGLVLDMFRYALHSDYGDIFAAEKLLAHIEPEAARRKAAAELDERLSETDPG